MISSPQRLDGHVHTVALALGCSLGDRVGTLETTVAKLDSTDGIAVMRVSPWVRTPPMKGGTARNWFLNGVALLEVAISPAELLSLCAELEQKAGRRRRPFWGDRPLDLDLLLVDEMVIDTPELTIPHPAIADRRFVLGPLLQVWPDATDPNTQTPYAQMPWPPGPAAANVCVVARDRPFRYL